MAEDELKVMADGVTPRLQRASSSATPDNQVVATQTVTTQTVTTQKADTIVTPNSGTVSAETNIDLQDTDKAFRVNRLTTTQRDALTALSGHLLFNTTTNQLEIYDGSNWVAVQAADAMILPADGTKDASAILELQSTTQGFVLPVMTTAQRNAISSPADGLMIYNSDSNMPESYDLASTIWRSHPAALRAAAAVSWTPGTVGANSSVTQDVTVTGAALGDAVTPAYDQDLNECIISAYVRTAGIVEVLISNPTSSGIAVTAGNVNAVVTKMS